MTKKERRTLWNTPSQITFKNVDLSLWPLIVNKVSFIGNRDVEQHLFRVYRSLSRISKDVDIQLEHAFLSNYPGAIDFGSMRSELIRQGILAPIEILLPDAEILLHDLRSLIETKNDRII